MWWCCAFVVAVQAQNQNNNKVITGYHQQIELRQDNDFLHYTDRYYSTGSFIGYRKLIETPQDSTLKRHYSIYLSQEIYTPADLEETNFLRFERPYAGFLGISNEMLLAKPTHLSEFKIAVGVTGPISGAEWVQSAFHSTVAEDSRISTWEAQIKNNFHFNLYYQYIKEWQWLPNPFSVHFAINPSIAAGTRDVYGQQDVVFYLGRRSALQNTVAYKQLGVLERELFFAVRLGYRYLLHDALIEGGLVGDDSIFLLTPYRHIFFYNVETFFRRGRHDVKFTCNYETPRTNRTRPHLYVSLSYGYSF